MNRQEIVSDVDLVDAVKDALLKNGAYNKLKSQLRAEIYSILEDKEVQSPEKPAVVFLAAEIIKEFLIKFKLNNTLSVFSEEMGHPHQMYTDKDFIGQELGLNLLGVDDNLPILIHLLQYLRKDRGELMKQSLVVEPDES